MNRIIQPTRAVRIHFCDLCDGAIHVDSRMYKVLVGADDEYAGSEELWCQFCAADLELP